MNSNSSPASFLTVPGEIQNAIVANLGPLELLLLCGTCRYFRRIIPAPGVADLLLAESDEFAAECDVYTCNFCVSLRHARHFSYPMMRRKRRRGEDRARFRFCIDCGLNPPPGRFGYGLGTIVRTDKDILVICVDCRHLKPPSHKTSHRDSVVCKDCWESREVLQRKNLMEAQIGGHPSYKDISSEDRCPPPSHVWCRSVTASFDATGQSPGSEDVSQTRLPDLGLTGTWDFGHLSLESTDNWGVTTS